MESEPNHRHQHADANGKPFCRSRYQDANDHRHLGQPYSNYHCDSWDLCAGLYTSGTGESEHWPGNLGTAFVYVNPEYGFTGNVNFSVSGLPSGVTASFSPNPTTGFSTLTLAASSSVPLGTRTLTITGTSGNLTETTTLILAVYTPTFTLSQLRL